MYDKYVDGVHTDHEEKEVVDGKVTCSEKFHKGLGDETSTAVCDDRKCCSKEKKCEESKKLCEENEELRKELDYTKKRLNDLENTWQITQEANNTLLKTNSELLTKLENIMKVIGG
jgi:hypothetical protein